MCLFACPACDSMLIDVDTGSDMWLSDCSSLVLSVFLLCFTCLDLSPTCVSLEHAHTSFVAELWLDFSILRRTCDGYRHCCYQQFASTGVHLSTGAVSLLSGVALLPLAHQGWDSSVAPFSYTMLYFWVCTKSPCVWRLFICTIYFSHFTVWICRPVVALLLIDDLCMARFWPLMLIKPAMH